MLDLWTEPLPVYGGEGVAAKMAVFAAQTPSGDQAAAWAEVQRLFARFDAADEYLFTVPMWNHCVPWVLKHLIDTISQPGMVFGFDPATGYTGLLADQVLPSARAPRPGHAGAHEFAMHVAQA